MKSILIAAALMLGASAAYAQNDTSSSSNNATALNKTGASNTTMSGSSNMSGMNNTPMREQVKNDLQKAGYQDVSVMPASFIVHAKDKNGRQVAMVMTPDSVFAVTDLGDGNGTKNSSAQNSNTQQ